MSPTTLGMHEKVGRSNLPVERHDGDASGVLYASDACLMTPGSPAGVGRDAIRASVEAAAA